MNLLDRYLVQAEFSSCEGFYNPFRLRTPLRFNSATDVVHVYAREAPEKRALVCCDNASHSRTFTFTDIMMKVRDIACRAQRAAIAMAVCVADDDLLGYVDAALRRWQGPSAGPRSGRGTARRRPLPNLETATAGRPCQAAPRTETGL